MITTNKDALQTVCSSALNCTLVTSCLNDSLNLQIIAVKITVVNITAQQLLPIQDDR